MIIFGGSNTTDLAWEVARELDTELGKREYEKFPDDEIYVRLKTDVEGRECAYVHSIKTSDDLVEALLMLDCLRDHGALQVHAVFPYLAYMRQDKRFKDGEALSAKTILKLVDEVSDQKAVINTHFLSGEGQEVYEKIRLTNLDAIPQLARYFKPKLEDPVVVAPDKGSMSYARRAAEILDCEFNHLQKKRISGEEVTVKDKNLDVKGKDVLMLDDIISTGGTILEASKVVKGYKPKSINVGCVHGLFLNGVEKFQGSVNRIIACNTLSSKLSKVSVAPVIARHLK